MRILFVTEDLANGGSERVISVLANGFATEHESAVAAIRWDKVTYRLDEKVKYYSFKDKEKGKIKRTIGRFSFLMRVIKEYKPDVVVAFDVIPIVYSSICCRIRKQKLVVSERADPKRHLGKGIISDLYFYAFKNSDGAVFQTEDAKRFYNTDVQGKSAIIPNPINEEFAIPRYEGERNKEIVTACRLTTQKNIKLFIDIVTEIIEEYPEFSGIVYGDGPEMEKLKNYTEGKNTDGKIIFAGKVKDLRERIYKSQIYLCTSDYEGISNSMLEAMSLGLTVISTDCPVGGAKMAITSGVDGILFPVGDKEAGTIAIKHLLENPQLMETMGKNATQIRERWSKKLIISKWDEYLRTLLER